MGAVLVAALAAGCVHPPQYDLPKLPVPAAYKEAGADMLQPAQPADHTPRAAWWEVFNDPQLNELEAKLMAGNPTLAQAFARYAQARAVIRQNRAQSYPQIGASGAIEVGRPSTRQGGTTNLPSVATDYTLTGNASWEIDFWGRIRQTVSVATANAQAAAGDREAIRLSLAAELATAYFQLRVLDTEIVLLNETTEAYEKSFQLTQNQYLRGSRRARRRRPGADAARIGAGADDRRAPGAGPDRARHRDTDGRNAGGGDHRAAASRW